MRKLRTLLASLLVALRAIPADAAPSTGELAELFMPAEISRPKLSPDGKYLGFLARKGDTYSIGLCDLSTGQIDLSQNSAKVRPLDFWWKTPRRALVKVSNDKLNALGYTLLDLDRRTTEDAWHLVRQRGQIFDAQPHDPHHVLMLNASEINRVNLDNGHSDTIDRFPTSVQYSVVDDQGRSRAVFRSNVKFGTLDLWWRTEAGGEWRSRHFSAEEPHFIPQALDADGIHLWGWEMAAGKESTFARFDSRSGERKPSQFLSNLPPTHLLMLGRTRQPVAVAYAQGATVRLFALSPDRQPALDRLQTVFAGFFPVIVDALADGKTWLVWVGNSRLPGAYFLFNQHTGEATLIAQSHNQVIAEERLVAAEYFTFATRSGQTLAARLWRPKDRSSPPPLIVFCPRQLPEEAALDLYQPEVQSFVAQGYAVLQVNVRGTTGFGAALASLSEDSMIQVQEDLEDAARNLTTQKIVDPSRLYLFGSYFAGVLAMEIATRSDCFAAIATVNVPAKVYRDDLLRYNDDSGLNSMTTRLGGWAESGKLARELSPVLQASAIKIPAIYLHDEDSIKGRPNENGRQIMAALGKSPIAKTGLAHGWSDKLKAPSLVAKEDANISLQIGNFFAQLKPASSDSKSKP